MVRAIINGIPYVLIGKGNSERWKISKDYLRLKKLKEVEEMEESLRVLKKSANKNLDG